MTILRVFWALFLAGIVAYAFHRSWRWEHGASMPEALFGDSKSRSKETIVWLDPAYLPLLLLVILLIFASMDGMDGGKRFLSLSLDVMIVISVYFLLLIFLLPIFRRYFSARACATMWVLPVFMFWQAHILLQNAPVPSFVIYIPSHILDALFFIWVMGFIVVFAGKFLSHAIFRRRVMAASYPARNEEGLALFESELSRLEFYHPVSLVISSAVTVPLSMGTRKHSRVTVLPNRSFTPQELQFIFRHEIHHLQRGDVNTKIFFAFCQALCWFNPLIWIATRKASDDLELSCEEIVLEDMDEQQRRQYAELLLNTAGHAVGFTTCLSAAAETMRYRLKNVMTLRRRWPGTLLLSISMFLCVMSYGTIAVSSDRGTVAEMITEHRTAADIANVYYQPEGGDRLREVFVWDGEGLFSYLASLHAEKLSSANEIHDLGAQSLSVEIRNPGLMNITIYDRMIEVFHFRSGGSREYFYLRSKPDWDTINSYLDLNAEAPKKPALKDLQMYVHFDVEELTEPIVATRHYFRAWDTATGETLRSSGSNGSPGGLYGLRPTQAMLEFDVPISEITVWVNEQEPPASPEFRDGSYFLPLADSSAHYRVDVVSDPVEGIRYNATYVFDVEYPE